MIVDQWWTTGCLWLVDNCQLASDGNINQINHWSFILISMFWLMHTETLIFDDGENDDIDIGIDIMGKPFGRPSKKKPLFMSHIYNPFKSISNALWSNHLAISYWYSIWSCCWSSLVSRSLLVTVTNLLLLVMNGCDHQLIRHDHNSESLSLATIDLPFLNHSMFSTHL